MKMKASNKNGSPVAGLLPEPGIQLKAALASRQKVKQISCQNCTTRQHIYYLYQFQ
jgi:hypothetical protein